ncbi:hypothetical protein BMG523Draft_04790 [Frankia sp. BMG5.23]|nr:hypothetical protein BMG523Draft_04790 [Frankia sp. BMG5.23]
MIIVCVCRNNQLYRLRRYINIGQVRKGWVCTGALVDARIDDYPFIPSEMQKAAFT